MEKEEHSMKQPLFQNVVTLDGKPWDGRGAMFHSYDIAFFNALKQVWPAFDDYRFVVHGLPPNSPLPDIPIQGSNVILLLISDESGRTLDKAFTQQFFAVLKTYLQTGDNVGNVLPFPLGDTIATENITPPPFCERAWEAGFIGCRNHNRLDLYRSLTLLKYLPPWPITSLFWKRAYTRILNAFTSSKKREFTRAGEYFTFTSGFAKGLSPNEYGQLLANTKIAVCPKGFIHAECYRIFEAMRMGCIIIADELPKQRWYAGSPIVIQKDWLKIHDTLRQLRNDPDKMVQLHRDTLAWWETVCSPRAVAEFARDALDALQGRS